MSAGDGALAIKIARDTIEEKEPNSSEQNNDIPPMQYVTKKFNLKSKLGKKNWQSTELPL